MGIFDLTHEALLLETNDLNDSESEKEHGGFEIAEEDYDSEVDEAIKKSAIVKSSYGESSLKDDGPDEYTLRFKHARKKFRRLKLLMEDMRQEQMQYIINTIKVLVLFLQITRKVNVFGDTSDQSRLQKFVATLDYRIKISVFIMMQRQQDDDRLNKVSKEAIKL